MSRVLVTGGSGRFADYMVKALRGRYDIVLFARTKLPEDRADLPWIQGDLNVLEDCQRAVEGVDFIHHLGAVPWPSDHPQVRESVKARNPDLPAPDATMRTNLIGTYYLLMAAVQAVMMAVNAKPPQHQG